MLSVLEKVTLKLWLREAQPYIDLRRPASHGIIRGWQAAELMYLIRTLINRWEEWQLPFMLGKPDIQQAYDSVLWVAIQWVFELRGFPTWLQAGYWRVHFGRVIIFRTCDDARSFFLKPQRAMPQGAPESPAIRVLLKNSIHLQSRGCRLTGCQRVCQCRNQ